MFEGFTFDQVTMGIGGLAAFIMVLAFLVTQWEN